MHREIDDEIRQDIFIAYMNGIKRDKIAKIYGIGIKRVFREIKQYAKDNNAESMLELIKIAHNQKGIVSSNVAKRYLRWKNPQYKHYSVRILTRAELEELYGAEYVDNNYNIFVLSGINE